MHSRGAVCARRPLWFLAGFRACPAIPFFFSFLACLAAAFLFDGRVWLGAYPTPAPSHAPPPRREWNSNARNCHVAQAMLRALLSSRPPSELLAVPGEGGRGLPLACPLFFPA